MSDFYDRKDLQKSSYFDLIASTTIKAIKTEVVTEM